MVKEYPRSAWQKDRRPQEYTRTPCLLANKFRTSQTNEGDWPRSSPSLSPRAATLLAEILIHNQVWRSGWKDLERLEKLDERVLIVGGQVLKLATGRAITCR